MKVAKSGPAVRPKRAWASAWVITAALGSAAVPAAAAESQVVFGGMFVVTTASASCQSLIGSSRTMFFSTVVFGNNRASLLITDIYQTLALSPETASFAASGKLTGTQTDRWNGVSTWSGSYSRFTFAPAKIKANTDSLTITGSIRGLNQDPGCTIGFRAVGVRT